MIINVVLKKKWLIQDPIIRPLVEQDSKTLQRLLPEIPLWVKMPDYDRVCMSTFQNSHSCSGISILVKQASNDFVSVKIDWLNRFIELMWPYLDKV